MIFTNNDTMSIPLVPGLRMNEIHKHLLIHNIGHNDLYLLLETEHRATTVLLPKDMHMFSVGEKLHMYLTNNNIDIIPSTRGDQFLFSPSIPSQALLGEVLYHKREKIIIGTQGYITGCILPIFIPVLLKMLHSCTHKNEEYHILFFTKGGNINAFQQGCNTYNISNVLQYIVHKSHPNITVAHLHDDSPDDDSFEGRPEFFRQQVIPHISRIRREVVNHYSSHDKEQWVDNFFVHLSLNTGTTTVFISTLNALQQYQPDLFHVKKAQLWPENVLEVEHINHQQFAQSPAVSIEHIDSSVQLFAIQKMQEWRDYFIQIKQIREQDKASPSFFFRKGKQEVLSLVVVRVESGDTSQDTLAYFRGVNLEVSLPTGSLCAERNAIGSALVQYPNLKRENILCIAVLSLGKNGPTLGPCGACQEWLRKVSMVNPDLSIITFANLECTNVYINPIPRE